MAIDLRGLKGEFEELWEVMTGLGIFSRYLNLRMTRFSECSPKPEIGSGPKSKKS
jgi:hypothetical protein